MTDGNAATLQDLIREILDRHHAYLWHELPWLDRAIASSIQTHGPQPPLLALQKVFRYFRRELEGHLRKEEDVLFPLIVQLETATRAGREAPRFPFGPIANPIGIMEQEHDLERRQLERMRQVTGNYTVPPDASETLRALFQHLEALEADMRQHVHLEDHILFPRASALEQ